MDFSGNENERRSENEKDQQAERARGGHGGGNGSEGGKNPPLLPVSIPEILPNQCHSISLNLVVEIELAKHCRLFFPANAWPVKPSSDSPTCASVGAKQEEQLEVARPEWPLSRLAPALNPARPHSSELRGLPAPASARCLLGRLAYRSPAPAKTGAMSTGISFRPAMTPSISALLTP